MKINVNEQGDLQLQEIFNPVALKVESGTLSIAERDSGIEIVTVSPETVLRVIYCGKVYEFKDDALFREGGMLDCTVCGKIIDVNEMYSSDACSDKCQNIILEAKTPNDVTRKE